MAGRGRTRVVHVQVQSTVVSDCVDTGNLTLEFTDSAHSLHLTHATKQLLSRLLAVTPPPVLADTANTLCICQSIFPEVKKSD